MMAPEVKKPRKGVYLLPNMITTLSMFLGFLTSGAIIHHLY